MPKHLELTGSLIGRERQQLILKIGSILLILACLTIGITAKASAATFTVDNLTDQTDRDCAVASKCTLRAAIEKSNATAGPNTIALGTGTYELSQGPIVISNNSVSINGTNGDPTQVIIDGKAKRAFVISGVSVTFNKLTIQNGKATPDAYGYGGGAIAAKLQAGNVLTLNGSMIKNNTAEDATGAGYGGGLYVTGLAGAKASIVNTDFTSNVAGERGGGMYIEGDLDVQIDQGSFVTNTAKTELGGGLAILAGSPSNSATITIVNSAFNQNKALGSSDDGIGGGLYLNAPATLTGTTFTGNTSNSDGGGMFLTVFDPAKTTGLTNVTFTNNISTTGKGPGLFIQNGNPVITNTKFAGNLPASTPSIGMNSSPVPPLSPASPMQTSDNKAYIGGSWTTKDVTIATDASIDGGATWNKGPITISTDGDYTTIYKQEDQLHNAVESQAVQVKLDKTKPVLSVSLTSGGQSYTDGTWTKDDIIVAAAASDTTSGVNARQYSIDGGGTWKTFTDNVAISIATSGQYSLHIKATDNAGNEELQSYSVKLDKQAPSLSTSLNSNGAPYVSDTWATNPVDLEITASDNDSGLSSTQYSFDNGINWNDYTAPVSITADGTYQVVVKAVDKLGNTAQQNYTVKVDTTKPTLSVKLISGGSDYTSGTWSKKSVTMDASSTTDSGSGLSLRQYSLNGGVSWTDYNNPLNISADGSYDVQFRATDHAGNTSQQSLNVKIDQTAPSLGALVKTNVGAPYVSDTWATESVTLELQPSDATSGIASVQYSLDNGTIWNSYSNPVTVTDGVYNVKARATDNAGNESLASWIIKVDTVAPELDVTMEVDSQAYPSDTWVNKPVTFKLSANDNGSSQEPLKPVLRYSLDGGTKWNNYTTGVTVTDGVYSVKAQASDTAGNMTEKSVIIKVDQTAPSIAVDMTSNGQPYVSGAWTSQDVTLQVTANDNVNGSGLDATQYSLDGEMTWEHYTAPVTLSADGTYAVVIKASDQLGNTSQVNVTVNIDAAKPDVSVELKTGDANYTEGTWSKQAVTVKATFADTVSGLSSKQYSLDGGTSWINYTGAFDLTSDGTYDVQVKAVNNAGNVTLQSFTVKIDQTAPSLAVDMTSNGQPYVSGAWTSQDVTLQVTANDNVNGSGLDATQYSLDGAKTWEHYTAPVTLSADGTYAVVIKASDQLGNTSQVNVTVNIDAAKPNLSVELKAGDANYTEGTWSKQTVTVEATFVDMVSGLSSKQYSIDGGTSWINYTGAFDLTSDGTYDVQVKAVNNAGNVTLQSFTVKIDQTAPSLAVDMTSNGQPYVTGAWTSQDVTLQASANDNGSGLSHLRYKLEDEASWSEYSGALTFTEAGHYKMMLQAEDQSGNLATADTTVNISKSAAKVKLVPNSSSLTNGDVGVSVTATVYGQNQGNTVSVAKFTPGDQQAAFFNGGGGQALPVGDLKFNAHDNGMYSVYVQDAAGNETVQKIEITQIVRDVPGLELSFSPSGLTNGQVTVSVTATVYWEEKGNSLQLKWADGIRDAAYFAASGNDLIVSENKASFAIFNNGIYSVYAKDLAGNHSIETIDIQNISRTKPTISLRAVPVDSTYEQFEITVTSAVYGSSNGIDTIKWAPGRLDNTYFEAGSGNVLGKNNPVSFKVTENRDYTVYVKDLLGNSDTQWITVTQINHAPTVSGHTVYGTQDTELTFSPADFPFIDADGDALVQIKLLSLPAYGVLQWNGRAATVNQAVYLADLTNLTYKPQAGWAGEDSFEWNGSDGKTLAAVPAIMKINIRPGTGPVNHPPSAGTVQLTTAMNTTVQGRLIGHDPDGDALTYSMDTQGKLGTFVLLNTTTGDFEYRPIPNATGTDTVTYSVYDIQRASASGTVQVTISPKSVSNRAELTSLSLSTGSLTPAFNAQVFSYNMNVTNAVYATTVTASVYEPRATLMINGISISSGKTSDPIALQQGYNTIVVKVVAEDGKSTNTYTITVYREPIHYPSNPSKGSGSSGTVPAVTDPNTDLKGQFNGKTIDDLGTVVTEKVDGQLVATATMDSDKVKELLEHAGSKPSFTVVINGDNDRAVLNMDSATVGMLQNSAATLQLQSNLGNYVLPFSALRMDAIAGQFGPQVNPADISLKITISKTAAEVVKQAQERAKEGQYSILFPPIDFTVTAVYKDRTSEIHVFSSMVRRELPVPADVNADRITTAVVVQQDGTVYHVPTRVTNHDGRSFAEISSLTNSTYTVIANAKAFDDMTGHWAQREVNNMASRMVVQGVAAGKYSPDSPVTRAQFAAIVIRALGLSDQGQQAGTYSDVRNHEWYAGVVAQASAFGLVSGYEDGTFRPDRTITREEALVIIARATKLAGQTMNLNTADPKAILSGFQDQEEIGDWALREAAQAVQSGLIQGSDDGLKPKSDMTRAETAVILYRLLVKTSLING
ncbi:S-layer homology domain-containing protein [Paenibacillus sp. RC67]|uniref:OmpL47-type beta-barrel domain-containing protein n=1 Tax=Paenibacillus sp. RC67 TaxID=3039392 RepID=UPI0024AE125D|nr:S-layer homology domain-containing protein [Paenibacillus sp. RC67]